MRRRNVTVEKVPSLPVLWRTKERGTGERSRLLSVRKGSSDFQVSLTSKILQTINWKLKSIHKRRFTFPETEKYPQKEIYVS